MDEVDSMQEQMNKLNREIEILRKDQKEMSEVKNPVAEVKNAFDGLISRLDMAVYRKHQAYLGSLLNSTNHLRKKC